MTGFFLQKNLDLQHTTDSFIETATDELCKFVNTEHFREEVFLGTDKNTRFDITDTLHERIENAVQVWQRDNIEKIFYKTVVRILGKHFKAIHEKLEDIKNEMRGIKTKQSSIPRMTRVLVSTIISNGGVNILGNYVVSRVAEKHNVSTVVAAVGIGGGILVSGLIAYSMLEKYATIRDQSFETIIGSLSKKNVSVKMREIYEEKVNNVIKAFMEDDLKNEITNIKNSIDEMRNELDMYIENEATLRSLNLRIKTFFDQLNYLVNLKIE